MPSWAGGRVSVCVDGNPTIPEWRGSYLELNGLVKGQEVVFDHPMRQEDGVERVGGTEYTVSWRGNTVMEITPPGKSMPLYRRRESQKEAAEAAML